MIRTAFLLPLAALAFAIPALAEGRIGTLERGDYVCELPGHAGGPARVVQPEAGFSIRSASRYWTPKGHGTYLRRGNSVTMTSGPRNGESYVLIGRDFLRLVEDDEPGRLRCVRRTG